jgi:O-acetyl-ADP-ribose deacetylase (regulator of RNase III)
MSAINKHIDTKSARERSPTDVRPQMIEVELLQADVTRVELDAIANAANTLLRHGNGVAAAIARAGGPEVQRESNQKAPIGLGEAVETTAGDMPARYVIHAATMELGGPISSEIITRATKSTYLLPCPGPRRCRSSAREWMLSLW